MASQIDYFTQITGGNSSSASSGSSKKGKYQPAGYGMESSSTTTGSTYATQPAPVFDIKNTSKWNKKVPQNGIIWDPSYKNYIFRDANGNLKKTKDFNTAFTTSGITEETPAEAMIANNQKFNLKGAAVRYDPTTSSYYFKDPVSGKLLTSSSLSTAYSIINPRPVTPPVDPNVPPTGPNITLPNGTVLKDTGATPPSGYRPTANSPQFYQPVYKPTTVNRAREGYSLFAPSESVSGGIGALPSPFDSQNKELTDTMIVENAEPAAVEQGMAYGGIAGLGALNTPFRRK